MAGGFTIFSVHCLRHYNQRIEYPGSEDGRKVPGAVGTAVPNDSDGGYLRCTFDLHQHSGGSARNPADPALVPAQVPPTRFATNPDRRHNKAARAGGAIVVAHLIRFSLAGAAT